MKVKIKVKVPQLEEGNCIGAQAPEPRAGTWSEGGGIFENEAMHRAYDELANTCNLILLKHPIENPNEDREKKHMKTLLRWHDY